MAAGDSGLGHDADLHEDEVQFLEEMTTDWSKIVIGDDPTDKYTEVWPVSQGVACVPRGGMC